MSGNIGFPPNVVSDADGPYGGVNPPPNSGASFDPPLAGGLTTPPHVSLIVQRDGMGRWLDDNGGDWTAKVKRAPGGRLGPPRGLDPARPRRGADRREHALRELRRRPDEPEHGARRAPERSRDGRGHRRDQRGEVRAEGERHLRARTHGRLHAQDPVGDRALRPQPAPRLLDPDRAPERARQVDRRSAAASRGTRPARAPTSRAWARTT